MAKFRRDHRANIAKMLLGSDVRIHTVRFAFEGESRRLSIDLQEIRDGVARFQAVRGDGFFQISLDAFEEIDGVKL